MFSAMLKPTRTTIQNYLLQSMPQKVIDRLWPQMDWVPLIPKTILLQPHQPLDYVYFIEIGSVSMIAMLTDGEQTEVGLVGPEGLVGLPVLLGGTTSPLEALVQAEGGALRLPVAAFRHAMADLPAMSAPLLRYVDAFLVQVAQTAICNGHHKIEQRLARWILMTHDRVDGDIFTMTQQFMSYMLGVQRPGITLAVGALKQAGLVDHSRGKMEVLDRPGLEATACECYGVVQRRFAWLAPAVGKPGLRSH